MGRILCALMIFTTLTSMPCIAKAVTLIDSPSCMEFLRDFNNNTYDTINKNWLLGFLSGMAYTSGRDVLKNTNYSMIYHSVHIYCKEYPDASLDEAAESFFEKLEKK